MTKKYRLNYNWNGYLKGNVFETKESGAINERKNGESYIQFDKREIDLLVLSGALTEIKETNCPCGHKSCPVYLEVSEVRKIDRFFYTEGKSLEWNNDRAVEKINELVEAFNNTKLK